MLDKRGADGKRWLEMKFGTHLLGEGIGLRTWRREYLYLEGVVGVTLC